MIRLTDTPIDAAVVLDEVRSHAAGAVVLFLGTVRESSGERQVRFLRYESYTAMAERTLRDLQDEAKRRWPLSGCSIVHRLGDLAVGETSVAIATSAAHREPAFEAGKWLIDRIKEVVPIWKQEHWADGTSGWVHPAKVPAEAVPGTSFGREPSPAERPSPKTVPGSCSGGEVTK
jgi:molybdopterin synthase catalytic subunit